MEYPPGAETEAPTATMSLYIFDKDGTLIYPVASRPGNVVGEQIPKPGVIDKLAELRSAGHQIAIATNQGGVAWGLISRAQAYRLAHDAGEKVGGVDAIAVCCYDPKATGRYASKRYAQDSARRKPHPGMLLDLMRRLGYARPETILVGDSETDEQAALAAGVQFIDAADFFEW